MFDDLNNFHEKLIDSKVQGV